MTAWSHCWKAWWVISTSGSDPAHGSRYSCSLAHTSGWRRIHLWFDLSQGSAHTCCLSPSLSQTQLSYSDPKRPPYSLSHVCPVTLLSSFLSHILFCPHLSLFCTVPSTTVSPLNKFLISISVIFFGHSFAPSLWLITLSVLFVVSLSPSSVFFKQCKNSFLSLCLPLSQAFSSPFFPPFYYFYSITHLTFPASWPVHCLPQIFPFPLSELGVQAASEWQGDIVCHISIPRQSPFSPESNYFFQSERFNLL